MLLHEFLKKLRPEELQKVRMMPVTDGERAVLEYVLNHREGAPPEPDIACNELDISDAYWRKTVSILLQKGYDTMVPEGGHELRRFLSNHLMHRLLKHLVNKEARQFKEQGEHDQLAELYRRTPELFLSGELGQIDVAYVESFLDNFLEAKPDAPQDEVNLIKLQIIGFKCFKTSAASHERKEDYQQMKQQLAGEIKAIEQSVHESSWSEVQYWLPLTKSFFAKDFGPEPFDEAVALQQMMDVYQRYPDELPGKYMIGARSRLAQYHYFRGNFERSYQLFQSLFNEYREPLKGNYYVWDIYAHNAIALGKLQEAEAIIREGYFFYKDNPEVFAKENFAIASVLALIYTLQEDYPRAERYIAAARLNCQKGKFFWIEAMIRAVDNSIHLLKGEKMFALNLVEKNLKFYRYHNAGNGTPPFADFHRLLRFVIRLEYGERKPQIPNSLKQGYQTWQQGEFAFIGTLLNKALKEAGVQTEHLNKVAANGK